ncbi:tRNA pseudouridine(38-40) synthase TruA [Alphaproteobacteria bacterium]|nr:tRNA pseudouridine(38-40) synthase TruA [Alphaproteobacteria bacterium]
MTRWKITIEYDGGPFVGWQRQAEGVSVQGSIEAAIEKFSQEKATLYGAGRTDSGVHALAQVAHFEIAKKVGADTVRDALNFHLKALPIAILSAEMVNNAFNARVSATARHYRYRILNRRSPATLLIGRVWHLPQSLNVGAMHDAAQFLVGHHDFTSFRATSCQSKSPIKTLDRLTVNRNADEIIIEASARSFLHHQMRNFVGTLKLVGDGKWSRQDVKEALDAKRRAAAGPTAPSDGLYLLRVDY